MATKKSTAAKSTSAKSAAKKAAPAKAASTKPAVKATRNTPASTSASKSPATHKEIADLAHKYFVERGHGHGSHVADWLRAEKDLNS